MKGVFDTRPRAKYNDDVGRHYHFPNRYLSKIKRTMDDWIVYRESSRDGGLLAYVAVARVARVEPDPSDPRSSYAHVSDYLEFDRPVPFRSGGRYWETCLNSLPPTRIGVALRGKSVRTISEEDFGAIVLAGLAKTLHEENPHRIERGDSSADHDLQAFVDAAPGERKRRIARMLVNRPLRDSAFRWKVVTAYDATCAVTGLRMVNGGGKAEVQAAHIRAVKDDGPDVVQNGIALSATCHWLFDRHLISLTDDYGLLVAHNRVPGEFRDLFSKQLKRIRLPGNEELWPRPEYVRWHRERFEGGQGRTGFG